MADRTTNMTAAELLAKLEAEVAQKLQAIAGIRLALGLDPLKMDGVAVPQLGTEPQRQQPGAPGVIRADEFFRMSIPDAIKKFLATMRQPQSPKAIADGLKSGGILSNAKKFYANITTALSRLEEAETLVNTPNGWALSEWYPNRPRSNEAPRKGKKKRPARKAKKEEPTSSANVTKLSDYQKFLSEQRRAGKSLKEISEAWKAKKAAG
jgi:hypothetical protein